MPNKVLTTNTTLTIIILFQDKSRINITLINIKGNNSILLCFSLRSHFSFSTALRTRRLVISVSQTRNLNCLTYLLYSAILKKHRSWVLLPETGETNTEARQETKIGRKVLPFAPHIPLITQLCVFYTLCLVHFSSFHPIPTVLAFITSHLGKWNYHLLLTLSGLCPSQPFST